MTDEERETRRKLGFRDEPTEYVITQEPQPWRGPDVALWTFDYADSRFEVGQGIDSNGQRWERAIDRTLGTTTYRRVETPPETPRAVDQNERDYQAEFDREAAEIAKLGDESQAESD